MAQGERILYPCYFNVAYSRAEGRKVPRNSAAKAPALADLEKAARRLNLTFRTEEHNHPAHWIRREGRIVVQWTSGKRELIKKMAEKLGAKR